MPKRLAGTAGPVLAMNMEAGLKNALASIKALSETDFKGLSNQDEINADLLEFLKSV
jgi:hypothetical protein